MRVCVCVCFIISYTEGNCSLVLIGLLVFISMHVTIQNRQNQHNFYVKKDYIFSMYLHDARLIFERKWMSATDTLPLSKIFSTSSVQKPSSFSFS